MRLNKIKLLKNSEPINLQYRSTDMNKKKFCNIIGSNLILVCRLVRENMRLVYGNDAPDNAESGVYQTSDYEYEVPTSDQDAVK